MSQVEILNELRKIRGKFEKIEGIKVYPAFTDHTSRRFTVGEEEKSFDIGTMYVLNVKAKETPIIFNLDRPITSEEYFIVEPYCCKVIHRITSTIYARTPQGSGEGVLIVEGLTIA